MKKVSIGVRLTLWYLALFAAAQCFFGAGMWLALRQHLYGMADRTLVAQVEDFTNLIKSQKKKNLNVPKLREEVSEAYVLEHSGDFLQVYDVDGNWIFRAPLLEQSQMAPVAAAAVKGGSFRNVELAGKPYRFLTEQINASGLTFIVQTGIPTDQLLLTLSMFRRSLLFLAPLALLAAAVAGYWQSRRALSPVDAMTLAAKRIGGGNLSGRLETLGTGDELQRLGDTINEMLGRIETAFRRVTEFTSDASHELRTPISLIRTEAEIALRKSRTDEEYREALRHILIESEKTSSLVEELLTLARTDSGREHLSLQPLELSSLVRATANTWRRMVEERDLQFQCEVGAGEFPVLADRVAMQRLMAILLDNAVKYTPPPGTVEVTLQSSNGKALITVRDTGIGIAEQDRTKIFERFYRVDKARSRELGGAGIGLAIADWIVKQHSGSIAVSSSSGCGSIFTVELALAIAEFADHPRPEALAGESR